MWDSSGLSDVREPAEEWVDTEVEKTSDGWQLTLAPSYEWLSDPARVYPVFVDPAVQVPTGADSHQSYKSSSGVGTSFDRVGNTRESNLNRYWRAVIHFPYPLGKQITGVTMRTDYVTGVAATYTGWIAVANAWSYNSWAWGLDSNFTVSNGTYYMDTPNTAERLAACSRGRDASCTFLLTGYDASVYSYKGFNTTMYYTWVDFPSVTAIVAPSPANGGISPLAPTLKVTGSDPVGAGLFYQYRVGTNPDPDLDTSAYLTPWSTTAEQKIPQGVLSPGVKYYWRAYVMSGGGYEGHLGTSTVRSSGVLSFTANTPATIPAQSSAAPTDKAVVTTLTPPFTTATSTDPDNPAYPVKYQFHLATGADGISGALAASGWLATPAWTPPTGLLVDGGSYTWWIETDDGTDKWKGWVNSFRVNLRLGTSGPSPFDAAGPATVNLANGNMSLGFSSPTVATVGGPMGLAFNYNSLTDPSTYRGLTGSYYDAGQTTPSYDTDGKTPVLVRTDPQVYFDWAAGSAGPAVPVDNFLAKWTGFITVPTNDTYTFGVVRDDGARIKIGGATVLDQWTSTQPAGVQWSSTPQPMTKTPTAIDIRFYDATGNAKIELWAKNSAGTEVLVPADWLTTKYVTLPAGWSTSTPIWKQCCLFAGYCERELGRPY